MAILRHRSICAVSALILAAVCALCIVAPGCALAAEADAQADDANSWRFADGQLLTVPGLGGISLLSSESYTEFDATLTPNGYATVNRQTGSQRLIPGAISKGIDVSEHNRTIDWEAAKNDGVKFASSVWATATTLPTRTISTGCATSPSSASSVFVATSFGASSCIHAPLARTTR